MPQLADRERFVHDEPAGSHGGLYRIPEIALQVVRTDHEIEAGDRQGEPLEIGNPGAKAEPALGGGVHGEA